MVGARFPGSGSSPHPFTATLALVAFSRALVLERPRTVPGRAALSPCLLHVSLGLSLLARGLDPEVAGEVACVISGRWPTSPHPSGEGGPGYVRLLHGVPGPEDTERLPPHPTPALAALPTPESFEPPGELKRRCAHGPSGHQGAPARPARG